MRGAALTLRGTATGSVSPVSSRVLRSEITCGQPPLISPCMTLSSSKPSWITVSRVTSPCGSSSNVTCDRGSLATARNVCSSSPTASASSGVIVCQEYDSLRKGSASRTTWSGSSIVTPWLSQVIVEPTCQSVCSDVRQ